MNSNSAVLRVAFASSTFVSLLVLLRAFISKQQFDASFWPLVLGSAAISLALLALVASRGHLSVPCKLGLGKFGATYLKVVIATYAKLAALLFLVLGLAIGLGTQSLRDAVVLAGLLAAWLSACLAPAVATFAVARSLRATANDA